MKENQRIAVTKRMLKEGLLRLLKEKPLDKVHINELCLEAGINRATFYRHYETPQDVLMELEKELVNGLLLGLPQQPPKTITEARKTLEILCTRIYDHSDLFKILFRCNSDEDMRRRLNDFYGQFWQMRKTEPQFANMDNETALMLTAMLGGGCYCLLRCWIMNDISKTPAEIAVIMSNVIRWPAQTDFAI